ncbi:MAG: endonuclease/exonuclease/phosphatase family protein [Kiritimatiellae bacterium]|nr:endonuclease/exonuclease/phosphatase family protein [Kiritimatiellia bacterium]
MTHEFFKPKVRLSGILGAAGLLAGAGTIAGFLGRLWWVFDLASSFRVQYFVVLTLLTLGLMVGRHYRLVAVYGALALANLAVILPLYWGHTPPAGAGHPSLRAMLLNVHTSNKDHDAVIALIEKNEPDLIVVQEVNGRWLDALSAVTNRFPHSIAQPRTDNFGIALFSRRPFQQAKRLYLGEVGVPSAFARIDADGVTLTVLATHPVPPSSAEYARWRDEQLEAVASFAASVDGPLLVMGDLNATPWSWHFRRLLRKTGLRDSSRGRGWQPTWPTRLFPLLVPIDHCLHSAHITIVDKTVGSNFGSDHYPVFVGFQIQRMARENSRKGRERQSEKAIRSVPDISRSTRVVARIERIATRQRSERRPHDAGPVAILDSRNERLQRGKECGRGNFELSAPSKMRGSQEATRREPFRVAAVLPVRCLHFARYRAYGPASRTMFSQSSKLQQPRFSLHGCFVPQGQSSPDFQFPVPSFQFPVSSFLFHLRS